MARATFINNDGQGFANSVEVQAGETYEKLLARQGITDPSKYHIRVNGQPVAALEQVQDGDRITALQRAGETVLSSEVQSGAKITVTPKNVGGANL